MLAVLCECFNPSLSHTHRDTLRQTSTYSDTHTNTPTDIHTDTDTHTHTQKQTHTHTNRHTHTHTHRETDTHTHTHRVIYIRTHREIHSNISLETKKKMAMTYRKTRLTPLTGGPKPPSSVCVLVTWLRKHLKRLGLADSAHCECDSEEQTPEHILQTRPHLETVHQQFWPEDTKVGTKLWGQAA